NRSALKAKSV
ncbi:tubulin/FtsZ family, GTPase domain protein, partial [Vibrio parahaemolyticus V-223/04]